MPIHQAILLAAGKGRRLGKLTRGVPKPMLSFGGKPILERNLEWLRNHGIRDVYINLHHLPDAIRDYFGNGARWDVAIRYSHEPRLLGTAGAVRKIVEDYGMSRRKEPFIVAYGDNLFEFDLAPVLRFYKRKKAPTMALIEKEDVEHSGIVLLDKTRRVVLFVEKPGKREAVSHLVNAGLYILTPEVLDDVPAGQYVDFGKDVFPEMIKKKKKIFGIVVQGGLGAIDTPLLYEQAAAVKNRKG